MYLKGDKIKVLVLEKAIRVDVRHLIGQVVTGIVAEDWDKYKGWPLTFKLNGGITCYVDDIWFSLIEDESKQPSCI